MKNKKIFADLDSFEYGLVGGGTTKCLCLNRQDDFKSAKHAKHFAFLSTNVLVKSSGGCSVECCSDLSSYGYGEKKFHDVLREFSVPAYFFTC